MHFTPLQAAFLIFFFHLNCLNKRFWGWGGGEETERDIDSCVKEKGPGRRAQGIFNEREMGREG